MASIREAGNKDGFSENLREVWKSLQKSPPFWGAALYVWLSLLGMSYSWSLYDVFGIDIFHFAEPSDFLLFALSEAAYFTILLLIVVAIVGYLLFYFWLVAKTMALVKKVLDYVYEFIKRYNKVIVSSVFSLLVFYFWGELKDQNAFAWSTFIVAIIAALISMAFLTLYAWLATTIITLCAKAVQLVFQFIKRFFPYLLALGLFLSSLFDSFSLGTQRGQDMLQGTQQEKEGMSAMLDLFEQENGRQLVRVTIRQDAVQPKTRLPKPDRTFLVSTTSSFHFFYECENDLTVGNAPECKNGRPFITPSANIASLEFIQNRPSYITAAITRLDTTINALKFGMIKGPDAIIQIKRIITSINKKNSEANTSVEQIRKLEPKNVTHVAPDQIVAVATIFKSYLEDRTKAKIDELNEKIATFNSTGVQNHCASGLEKVATIGPFPQGHGRLGGEAKEIKEKCQDQLVTPDQLATLDRFFCQMNKHFTNHKMPQHLMLIGRVDSEPLKPDALQFYGPQINLAQARAEWVRGELLKKFPTQIDHQQVTLRAAGPLHVGQEVSDDDRAKDRTVEVYACWTPKDSE